MTIKNRDLNLTDELEDLTNQFILLLEAREPRIGPLMSAILEGSLWDGHAALELLLKVQSCGAGTIEANVLQEPLENAIQEARERFEYLGWFDEPEPASPGDTPKKTVQ